jgi:hypothetical protein
MCPCPSLPPAQDLIAMLGASRRLPASSPLLSALRASGLTVCTRHASSLPPLRGLAVVPLARWRHGALVLVSGNPKARSRHVTVTRGR